MKCAISVILSFNSVSAQEVLFNNKTESVKDCLRQRKMKGFLLYDVLCIFGTDMNMNARHFSVKGTFALCLITPATTHLICLSDSFTFPKLGNAAFSFYAPYACDKLLNTFTL